MPCLRHHSSLCRTRRIFAILRILPPPRRLPFCRSRRGMGLSFLQRAGKTETAFIMTSAMLQRICLSGPITALPETNFALVKEGIRVYKQIRSDIRTLSPFILWGYRRLATALYALHFDINNVSAWRYGASMKIVKHRNSIGVQRGKAFISLWSYRLKHTRQKAVSP